ncbi:MAG: hypothetical protein EAZ76_08745 [Nostocales cyanobacterium]|nr:MAG: hypothetical protein EAZ87_19120 [Nostocales cyanobacterium]TAF15256.1 MAG: hypothetical protein EAZ76_08745 [Nostocales cyanobacterium]
MALKTKEMRKQGRQGKQGIRILLFCLLPLASCLLPIPYSLFPIPYSLFPEKYATSILPTTSGSFILYWYLWFNYQPQCGQGTNVY